MATREPSTARKQYPPIIPLPHSLWAAAKANNPAELARLLDAGYPIDERDHRGYSPLMLAGYAGHLEAVELLLARGADTDTTDWFGNTVLMGATFKGHLAVVLRLLAAGADADRTNHGGLDARGFALTYGRDDVFAALYRSSVPPELPSAPATPSDHSS